MPFVDYYPHDINKIHYHIKVLTNMTIKCDIKEILTGPFSVNMQFYFPS